MSTAAIVTLFYLSAKGAQSIEKPDLQTCWDDVLRLPTLSERASSECRGEHTTLYWRDMKPAEPPAPVFAEKLNELAPAAGEHIPPLCSDYELWKDRIAKGKSVQDMLDCGGDAPMRMDNSADGRGEV